MAASYEDERRGEEMPLLDRHGKPWKPPSITLVSWLLILLIFALAAADELQNSPMTRIFESIYCRSFYREHEPSAIGSDGWVPEELCKIEPVQSSVAFLKGWQVFLDCIPSTFLAIPFGWVADKYGRKPILIMISVSYFVRYAWQEYCCYFLNEYDLRWTWLSALHAIFGGSAPVLVAVIFSMISDIVPEQERAVIFLRVGAAQLLCSFVTPPIAAALMQKDPWIPLLLALVVFALATPISLIIPETLHHRADTSDESYPLQKQSVTSITELNHLIFHNVKSATTFLLADPRVLILTLTFGIHYFITQAGNIILQYISKRFHWTLANATYLFATRSGMNLICFLFILPRLSKYLTETHHLPPSVRDLYLARGSAVFMGLALFILGCAPTVTVFAIGLAFSSMGNGTALLVRSILTSMVEKHHVARLYAIISVVDTLALMAAGPVQAGLFKAGMRLGVAWMGLPWWVMSVLVVGLCSVLWVIRVDEGGKGDVEGGVEAAGRLLDDEDEDERRDR